MMNVECENIKADKNTGGQHPCQAPDKDPPWDLDFTPLKYRI